jgi:hypothetical protein
LQNIQPGADSVPAPYPDSTSGHDASSQDTPDYPHVKVLDFLHRRPVFNVDSAGMQMKSTTCPARMFYNYVAPVVYFYRLPIVLLFLVWSTVFGVFAFRIGTKSELQFLPDNHVLQRGYNLSLNKFSTALNDFSFASVWGINPTPDVKLFARFTTDDYGTPTYYPINVSDPAVQNHITDAWDRILRQDFIDANATAIFGMSPWNIWNQIIGLDTTATGLLLELVLVDILNMAVERRREELNHRQIRGDARQ